MKRWLVCFALIGFSLVSTWQYKAAAQATDQSSGRLAAETTKEIVEYKLSNWKTAHASDDADAKKMIATLKQLKCEVKTSQHGNHIDITYRCEQWKQMSLPDHKTAHQWEAWLKKYGFETKHTH